jgi:hypothetical protein
MSVPAAPAPLPGPPAPAAPLRDLAVAPAATGPWRAPAPAKRRSLGSRLLGALTVRSTGRIAGIVVNPGLVNGPVTIKAHLAVASYTHTSLRHPLSDEQKFDQLRGVRRVGGALPPARARASATLGAQLAGQRGLVEQMARIRAQAGGPSQRASELHKPIGLNRRLRTRPDLLDGPDGAGLTAELVALNQLKVLERKVADAARDMLDVAAPARQQLRLTVQQLVDAARAHRVGAHRALAHQAAELIAQRARAIDAQAGGPALNRAMRWAHDRLAQAHYRNAPRERQPLFVLHQLDMLSHAIALETRDHGAAARLLQTLRDGAISALMRQHFAAPAGPSHAPLRVMARLAELPHGIDMLTLLDRSLTDTGARPSKQAAVARAYQLDALQVFLRATRCGSAVGDPRLSAQRLLAVKLNAMQRFDACEAMVAGGTRPPVAPSADFGLLRNGLAGAGGELGALDEIAGELASFHTKLVAQQAKDDAAAGAGAHAPVGARGARSLLRPLVRAAARGSAAIATYVPVAAFNPATLAALHRTSYSFSADVTDKTVKRLDSDIGKMADGVARAALAMARVPRATPRDAAGVAGDMRLLAQAALVHTTLAALGALGAAAPRPEHARLGVEGRLDGNEWRAGALHRRLALYLDGAGIAATPAAIEAAGRAALASVGGAPLTLEHLGRLLETMRADPRFAAAGLHGELAEPRGAALAYQRRLDLLARPNAPARMTPAQLRATMHAFVRRAELRNKFRVTAASGHEINLRPATAGGLGALNEPAAQPLPAASGGGAATRGIGEEVAAASHDYLPVGIGFRVRGEFAAARSDYFEASYSAVGLEITIGTEERRAHAQGAGVSLSGGYADAIGSAKLAGGVEVARGNERIVHHGVRFCIPRSTSGAYTDDEARDGEYAELVDALFPAAGAPATAGDPHGHVLAVLARCPHVSISLIGDSADSVERKELAVNAGFLGRLKVVSLSANVGWQGGRSTRRVEIAESRGSVNVERVNQGMARVQSLGAGIGAGVGLPIPGRTRGVFGTLPLASVNVAKQVKARGTDEKFRLVTENGKTQAVNTRHELEFSSAADLNAYIDLHSEEVVALAMAAAPDSPGATPSTPARRRADAEQRTSELKARIGACEFDGRKTTLRNVFAASMCLTEAAALHHDTLVGGRRMLAQHAGGAQLSARAQARDDALWRAQDRLLDDPSSWRLWKITGSERTAEQSQVAFDVAYKFYAQNNAESQRALFSFPG